MSAPVWVPLRAIILIHDRQIARHGGPAGLQDLHRLERAVARVHSSFAAGATGLCDSAAAYANSIAKAQAFKAGNTRTGFVTAATFLRLNGLGLRPDPFDGLKAMGDLAAGLLSEAGFSAWLGARAAPLSQARTARF
jgi:death on curing protein